MAIHALKARYVFPVSGRPIENGLIGIEGQRIAAVGKHVSADTVEHLGNVAILPGLVNAHTHLEFSNLAKPLGNPGINFVDWLRLVIEYRRQMNSGDFTAIEAGLQECTRCGVTTIGAIAQPDCPLSLFENHSVDGAIYFELIAPTHERIRDIFGLKNSGFSGAGSEFISKINPELRPLKPEPWIESRTLNPEHSKWQRGLSPHAPYSVHLDLMPRVIDLSVHLQFPLAIHLAESRE
jgi:cytosine/adenosine deaminase-related metal-dependent hydrolase